MLHGLDTASRKWHVIREDGQIRHRRLPDSVGVDDARIELADTWRQYVDSEVAPGDKIVCEEPLALRSGKTSRILSLACGAIFTATYWPYRPKPKRCERCGNPFNGYAHGPGFCIEREWAEPVEPPPPEWRWADVSHWKRTIVGNGNADKAMIEAWVREHLGLEFEEPDHYDAACLLEFGKLWEMLGHKPPTLAASKKKKAKKT